MGIGDNIMAAGMARGAAARGKRVAFGDGKDIIWDHHSEMVFRGNPNVAPPGMARLPQFAKDLEWINYYRGSRLYNQPGPDRWIWNMQFKAQAGELYFTDQEKTFASRIAPGFVVMEPNVPEFKTVAANKQWPTDRYQRVATALLQAGHKIVQFVYGAGFAIEGASTVKTPTFRHAAAVLSRAALYIGPEGGMHHAAAAVGVPAIVLFGGFIPPSVTGYNSHTNLTGGAEACGSWLPCNHCKQAMMAISSPQVIGPALEVLKKRAA